MGQMDFLCYFNMVLKGYRVILRRTMADFIVEPGRRLYVSM